MMKLKTRIKNKIMSKITAAEVNKLRKATGAGMMDCKKALVEADGNFEAAIENLRKKGQKVAAKRADRESSEGAVIAMVNDSMNKGVVISLNCETDFVAKNESFIEFAKSLCTIAINCSSIFKKIRLPIISVDRLTNGKNNKGYAMFSKFISSIVSKFIT